MLNDTGDWVTVTGAWIYYQIHRLNRDFDVSIVKK
jgi:hypothetical protein